MQVILAGGSGFLGRALHQRLRRDRHAVAVLTRRPRTGVPEDLAWIPDGSAGSWAHALNGADAVVNLAGEGIADRRWTAERKRALRDSRLLATRSLVAAMRQVERPPRVLINASGIGYYGARGDEVVTEATPPGVDFLAQLCVDWESEAHAAAELARVVVIRNGLVLHTSGGALAKMLLPFRLGLGGPLGSGTQYFPWIHLDDWLDLVMWLMADQRASGPFNGTAPNPVTNADFTRALGHALSRPAVIPVPGFGLRIALGELASSLLSGQRAVPGRALEMGFEFRYPEIESALANLLR